MTIVNPKDDARAARYRQQQLRQRKSIAKIQNSSSYASPGVIIGLSLGLMAAIAFFAAMLQVKTAEAFVIRPLPTKQQSSSTKIFLEGTFVKRNIQSFRFNYNNNDDSNTQKYCLSSFYRQIG